MDIERAKVNNVHVITHGNNATGADNIDTRSSMNGGSRPLASTAAPERIRFLLSLDLTAILRLRVPVRRTG